MTSTLVQNLQPPSLPQRVTMAVVVLALLGCTSSPPGRSGESPASATAGAAVDPRAAPLEVERHWLQSWFKGTPVLITRLDDGSVSVDVPREFCFDSGRSAVKPALGAVLDKVAESLRRNPKARLQLLAAPGDGAADSSLAVQRAGQVRTHLRSRGVADARLGSPTRAMADAVQLRMTLASP